MKRLFFIHLMCIFIVFPEIAFSQDVKERKAVDEINKKKQQSQEEVEKELIKGHLKIQQKATRKRIKRSLREAERRKKGKSPYPWWDRWFNRKQQKKRRKRL